VLEGTPPCRIQKSISKLKASVPKRGPCDFGGSHFEVLGKTSIGVRRLNQIVTKIQRDLCYFKSCLPESTIKNKDGGDHFSIILALLENRKIFFVHQIYFFPHQIYFTSNLFFSASNLFYIKFIFFRIKFISHQIHFFPHQIYFFPHQIYFPSNFC
jgi:hypothetical protein